MDIVCADTFMATTLQTLGIDHEHGVKVYSGKTASLRDLITYLKQYVAAHDRVNRPAISAFVLPVDGIKTEAFKMFYDLGMAATRGFRGKEYVEVFGFDDGRMPQYELRQMPGRPVPFYGLHAYSGESRQRFRWKASTDSDAKHPRSERSDAGGVDHFRSGWLRSNENMFFLRKEFRFLFKNRERHAPIIGVPAGAKQVVKDAR
jgi:hypothetical protein